MNKQKNKKMVNMASSSFILSLLLLLVNFNYARCQSFIYQSVEHPSSEINDKEVHQPMENHSPISCEIKYGFLPCSQNLAGHTFQIVLYEYLLFHGANYVSAGSELMFEIIGPNVFGGSVFRILCAIPKSLILLESALSQGKEKAESKVMVGMGMLAGSTIFLLTLLWGSCVVVGKGDLEDSTATFSQDTKGLNLLGSGIKTDKWTTYAARIMATSVIPFIFIQIRLFHRSSSGRSPAILVALIACIIMLISYAIYQVFHPWIQRRSLEYVKDKHLISGILRHLNSQGRLIGDDGDVNREVIRKLFRTVDANNDGRLSASELRALIIGIQFEAIHLDHEDAVQKVMRDLDTSSDSYIDEEEFVKGITKWLDEAKRAIRHVRIPNSCTVEVIDHFHQETKKKHDMLSNNNEKDNNDKGNIVQGGKNRKKEFTRAIFKLVLGIAIATIFAGPLVDAVNNFSTATSIPSFFTSFVVLPLATNLKGAVSALTFVSKKKTINVSLALSEIYGAVFMNNTLGLAVYLALVYINDLKSNFSAEVWAIMIVCIFMSLLTSIRAAFPLWTSIVAFLFYPFSLFMVYVQRK